MHYSEAEFREIVNRVIIPVSEINNHPLGGKLLDEFLRGFDKPAQRDIWWSIPTYLRNNYNASWRTFSELDLSMIALSDKDNYMGKPLILVWRLSSVDNDVRRDCRLKLTEWGINNPYEYLDLLLYCADINDEQIVEDIFAIAYGIALGKFVQKEYLEKLSSWIVENVYSEEGLFKYENSAIRYYCKGIVKIAISKGLCDAECEKRISEKYIRKSSFMPAYKDSFDSKRLSGYGPIYYDLARYVLCDHLDRFFCINYKTREYLREAEEFIEKYKKKYDVDMLEPEGLIISIAFQYLLNQGWDEKIFWECEDKNNLGIDICIRNTYMRSTHGAKSKVMTVAEKYVWCVKHRMEAVFASQLQYNYYGQGVRYISDYYEIDDFTNTYQDYVNSRYTKIEDKWIHTDQMVKTPYKEFSAENIEKWMKKKDTPDFTVWLGEKTDARILYAYTNIVNEVLGIEEAIWISSGIVKNNDFEKLIAEVNVYSEERSELLNVAEFHSYVETCGFYTPQEVCAVQSVKEANESINIGNEKNVIQVYKLVATCLSEHIENIEKTFYLPSRITFKGQITRTALMLLGKKESSFYFDGFVPRITWTLYNADKSVKAYEHFDMPLLLAVDKVYGKIRNEKYRYIADQTTLFPEEVDQYNPNLVKEIINNCIAHSDYRLRGKINLEEYEDHLVFINEGAFIPETVEQALEPGYKPPYYRNAFLCNAMVNMYMIDTNSMGIPMIYEIQKGKCFPLPTFDLDTPNRVVVTVYGKVLDPNYTRLLHANDDLDLRTVFLLDQVQKKKTISKEDFSQLKSRNLVEGRYPNIFVSYKVAKVVGDKANYVRQKGLDEEVCMHFILSTLKLGPAKKSDLLAVLKDVLPDVLTDQQKSRKLSNLLQKMKKNGIIDVRGIAINSEWYLLTKD